MRQEIANRTSLKWIAEEGTWASWDTSRSAVLLISPSSCEDSSVDSETTITMISSSRFTRPFWHSTTFDHVCRRTNNFKQSPVTTTASLVTGLFSILWTSRKMSSTSSPIKNITKEWFSSFDPSPSSIWTKLFRTRSPTACTCTSESVIINLTHLVQYLYTWKRNLLYSSLSWFSECILLYHLPPTAAPIF